MKESSIIEKQIQHLGKEVPLLILGWSTLIPPEADRTVKDTLVKNLNMEKCILKKKKQIQQKTDTVYKSGDEIYVVFHRIYELYQWKTTYILSPSHLYVHLSIFGCPIMLGNFEKSKHKTLELSKAII